MAAGILDKLAPLADKVATLGNKHRGDAIEAADWNAMIDVLHGLLDAVGGQETALTATFDARYATKVHDHVGEVTVDWLDASLRASIGAPGGPITLRATVDDVSKSVASFAQQIAMLQAQVQSQQRALDQFSVDGLDAKQVLTGFEPRVTALEGLRTNVTTLTAQLNGLAPNIDTVMKLRTTLSDATGKPIDVGKIQADVATLQTAQANLTGLDGTPVRIRDILVRQQNVEQALGVDGAAGLQTRINAAVDAAKAPLVDAVGKTVDARVADVKAAGDASIAALHTDVAAQLDTARTALSQAADAKIAAAGAQLATATTQQIATANAALRADVLDAANKNVQAAVAGVPAQVQTAVTALRGDLQKTLADSLTSSLTATVTAQLGAATAPLTDRVTKIEGDVSGLHAQIPGQIAQAVTDARTATTAALTAQVDAKLATARTAIDTEVGTSVTTAVTQAVAPAVDQALQARAPAIAAQVSTAVNASVQTIPTTVTREVQAQVAALNLDTKLQQQQTALSAQLTAQVDQKIAAVDAKQSGAIADLNTRLSSRIDSVAAAKPGTATGGTVVGRAAIPFAGGTPAVP